MAAEAKDRDMGARSLSLPSLHKIHRQKGKFSTRSNASVGLPSMPSTPSTAASSRATPCLAASFRSTASSAASWDHTLSSARSSCSSLYVNLPRPDFKPLLGKRDFPVLHSASQVPRPDEELLDSVCTDVVWGSGDSVEYIYDLIQGGADVNQRNERGFTALAVATAAGSEALVSLLLERNADPALASTDRAELPLHYAASLGHHVICHLLLSMMSATAHSASSVGWTPLHLAVASGHEPAVRTLLRAKALPDTRNDVMGGLSSLHLSIISSHAEVLELLLEHDGDPNISDSLNRTPLHMAALRADATSVALLLRYRADPLSRVGRGNTLALDLVPSDQTNAAAVRTCQLLSAYTRKAPLPLRTDDRFDLPGGHDVLSAYSHPVPWGRRSNPRCAGIITPTFHEWREDDEDAVWL